MTKSLSISQADKLQPEGLPLPLPSSIPQHRTCCLSPQNHIYLASEYFAVHPSLGIDPSLITQWSEAYQHHDPGGGNPTDGSWFLYRLFQVVDPIHPSPPHRPSYWVTGNLVFGERQSISAEKGLKVFWSWGS